MARGGGRRQRIKIARSGTSPSNFPSRSPGWCASFAGETGEPRPTVRPAGARDAIPGDGVPLGQEPYVKPRDLRELRKKKRS
jgi:hypothetical protein